MAFYDRVKFTTATTGTGTITVGAAVSGFRTPAGASIPDAGTFPYVIEDGTAWEIGTGTYTSSGTTVARSLISSSTGSLISLSGSAVVYVSAIASTLGFAPLAGATFTGKLNTMAPSATEASINIGTISGNPSALVNGDFWINATRLSYRDNAGTTRTLALSGGDTFSGTVTFRAGSTSANTQPVKFQAGSLNTTAVAHSMEWDGTYLYLTNATPTRKKVQYVEDLAEEGSITPALKFGGASTSMTSTGDGRYKKIGNTVFFWVRVTLTAKGSSTGTATITGLPYASLSLSGSGTVFTPLAFNMASTNDIRASVGSNSSSLSLWDYASNNAAVLNETHFTNTSEIYISGLYFTA